MDHLLQEVQEVLDIDSLDDKVKKVINNLAKEYLKNQKRSEQFSDVIPDIEEIKYRAAIDDGLTSDITGGRLENIRTKLQEHLRDKHAEKLLNITSDRSAREAIEKEIRDYCTRNGISIEGQTLDKTVEILKKDLLDYGVLTDLIFDYDSSEDQKIEEIRQNDWNDIRVVIKGIEYPTKLKHESPEQALAIAQKMCRNSNALIVKKSNPFVRLRMGNTIRVSIMTNSVARCSDDPNRDVVQMTIRKQANEAFSKEFLLKEDTIDEYGYELITTLIKGGISMAFYGGTNCGKTGTMNSFIHKIDNDHRTITIAEIDEMNLRRLNEITGEAENSVLMWEIQPKFNMGFKELVNSSLTFTPQTLVLQEMKGPEAIDVVDAAITGHQAIVTLHASNIKVFAKRILSMYKQGGSDLSDDLILEYVAEAFPIVVKMEVFKDGKRRITEIAELGEYDRKTGKFNSRTLYEFEVQNSSEEAVYDSYLDEHVTRTIIKGKHAPREFLSLDILRLLKVNGITQEKIDKLSEQYEKLKEKEGSFYGFK